MTRGVSVKGSVPITNQSIPQTQELTQLECGTLQLPSEAEHCRLPPANVPTHGITTSPSLHSGEEGRHTYSASSSCNTARLDRASVQSDTQSIIQPRTSFSPAACAKQGQQWIQTRLLKALSQVLEVLPGKPVQCGTEQDKRYPRFQSCVPLHARCTATLLQLLSIKQQGTTTTRILLYVWNIPCSTLLQRHYVKEKDIKSQLKSIIICMILSNTFDFSTSLSAAKVIVYSAGILKASRRLTSIQWKVLRTYKERKNWKFSNKDQDIFSKQHWTSYCKIVPLHRRCWNANPSVQTLPY